VTCHPFNGTTPRDNLGAASGARILSPGLGHDLGRLPEAADLGSGAFRKSMQHWAIAF
jgi:hypothetical protein